MADQRQLGLSAYGNPGMATAGMGDVLAGICGGLVAQSPSMIMEQLKLAVLVHGLAGDLAVQKSYSSLVASDVIAVLGEVLP